MVTRYDKLNNEKSIQLGMPFGTASHRLRKAVLFKYVQKAGDDVCFKCNKKIISIDELTIEHKKVWLHINPELFWDLNNIAFSHKICNKAERQPLKGNRPPHGTNTRYSKYRCRCEPCRIAANKRKQIWRKKRKIL